MLSHIQIINHHRVSHKSKIHDKEDDENQSINQKLMRGENLENDNQEHNQDDAYKPEQAD